MASAVTELGHLLRGGAQGNGAGPAAGDQADGGAAAAAAAAAVHGVAVDAQGLNIISRLGELSDCADKELQAAGAPMSHEDAAAAAAAAEEQQKMLAAAAAASVALPFDQQQLLQSMALMPGVLGMDWSHAIAVQQMPEEVSDPQPGPRSKSGKPTRRGPMDEMRQLVRILVKLLPQSIAYIGANEEAGGGNRISEEQIKNYLEKTLGEAPRPSWGVPNGWYSYVAELFSWALGRPVDEEQCKKCAKREPGRSWEALDGELAAIGVHPQCWPLPLSLVAVRDAEKNPIVQPIPQMPVVKRGGGEGESTGRGRRSGPTVDLDRLTEYELWKHLGDVLNACTNKNGTSPPDVAQQVANLKNTAKNQMDMLTGGGLNMLQYVPVMGLDGNPSLMAFMGGMQGMPMGLPPVTGQLVGADGQVLVADGAAMAAATAAAQAAMAAGGDLAAAAGMAAPGEDERAAKRQRHDGGEGGPTSSTEDDGQGDKSKGLSSSEARGTLFGALGAGDATKEAAGAKSLNPPAGAAAQQLGQLPMAYGAQNPMSFFPPGFPVVPGAFPGVDGSVPAEGAPVSAKPEGEA